MSHYNCQKGHLHFSLCLFLVTIFDSILELICTHPGSGAFRMSHEGIPGLLVKCFLLWSGLVLKILVWVEKELFWGLWNYLSREKNLSFGLVKACAQGVIVKTHGDGYKCAHYKFSHWHRLELGEGTGMKPLRGWILGGFGVSSTLESYSKFRESTFAMT